MNKAGIIDAVAKSLDCSKSQADIYVNTILETIKEGVRGTGKVQLMGFGTFEARQTKAREGRNPRTGEPMMIAASTRCAFKVGKQFKVTRERIRQIEAKALRKMRHPTRIRQLSGFLEREEFLAS